MKKLKSILLSMLFLAEGSNCVSSALKNNIPTSYSYNNVPVGCYFLYDRSGAPIPLNPVNIVYPQNIQFQPYYYANLEKVVEKENADRIVSKKKRKNNNKENKTPKKDKKETIIKLTKKNLNKENMLFITRSDKNSRIEQWIADYCKK